MAFGTIGTLGTDPDYASLLGQRNDPRLLMAQKLMDMEKLPASNSSKSSFWANLLNQGRSGAASGYLYNDVQADREKEATAQRTEAGVADTQLQDIMKRLGGGGAPVKDGSGGTAPAQPSSAPGPRESLGGGALPPEQQQAIVTSATNGTMVPPPLLHALITQESGWKPNAQGKGSDFGLGQVTASTAANPGYGLPPLSDADRADPYKNAAWSARYLEARGKAAGLTRPEDWSDPAKLALALKAYNGGGDPNYVQNVTRHMQGRQADATPAPGSNLDALLRGVDQPKPRGIQLAENLLPGGTATDSPTPILPNMAPVSTATAPLPLLTSNAPPPPPEPAPPPPEPAPPPQPPVLPVPGVPPGVPPGPSNMPTFDDPQGFATAQPPPLPPAPLVGTGSGPEAGPTDPNAPLPLLTPPSQAPMVAPPGSGETGGQPTIPPQPPAEAAPAGSGETGGQPTVLPQEEPPLPVPPIPPALLARRLQQAAPAPPAGGGDNATEALNTASLAAARRGETFVPGAGPTGQQLAAPLLPPGAASPATPDDAAMYAAGYGPTGGGAPGDQGGLASQHACAARDARERAR
jgi:soluble lytic murein transglycosylase-like protein